MMGSWSGEPAVHLNPPSPSLKFLVIALSLQRRAREESSLCLLDNPMCLAPKIFARQAFWHEITAQGSKEFSVLNVIPRVGCSRNLNVGGKISFLLNTLPKCCRLWLGPSLPSVRHALIKF